MRLVLTFAAALLMGASQTSAGHAQELAALEAEAIRALNDETETLSARAPLVDRLRLAAERAPTADQRGRLALLWLRGVRWLLEAVPFGRAEQAPYREWLAQHEPLIVYSEPAGQWLIDPELMWDVHEAHRTSPAADDIGWLAVENGYPGECEGYIPCYANVLNRLHGEYLRRHPRGRHVLDAVTEVRTSLDSAFGLLSDPSPADFLDPATDCDDLEAGLVPLRRAVSEAAVDDQPAAIGAIDRLLARCRG